jgi:hypothetical protein
VGDLEPPILDGHARRCQQRDNEREEGPREAVTTSALVQQYRGMCDDGLCWTRPRQLSQKAVGRTLARYPPTTISTHHWNGAGI